MKYNDIQNKIIELVKVDKCLHFIVGFFLAITTQLFFNDLYSFVIVFIIAFLKEVRDEIVYKGFDWKDIVATILPAIILTIK